VQDPISAGVERNVIDHPAAAAEKHQISFA
jgi:hypothetical protein